MIVANEIDYNTRVYRLVLDHSKQYVTKIACCGAAFPVNSPIGTFFDFNNDRPYFDQIKDISIRLRCTGAIYLDDIVVRSFNKAVSIFNPDMRPLLGGLSAEETPTMAKIHRRVLPYFNNRGYPRINISNYELEWWIDKPYYDARVNRILELIDPTNAYQIARVPGSESEEFDLEEVLKDIDNLLHV
jgi:hypothetical protein